MHIKRELTAQCIKALEMSDDITTFRKYMRLWWNNPESRSGLGLSLTSAGYEAMLRGLNLKFYTIALDESVVPTNQLILWLDKFLDCPYCLLPKEIIVSREKIAVQLMLYGGDLYKFGKSMQMSKDRDIELRGS